MNGAPPKIAPLLAVAITALGFGLSGSSQARPAAGVPHWRAWLANLVALVGSQSRAWIAHR